MGTKKQVKVSLDETTQTGYFGDKFTVSNGKVEEKSHIVFMDKSGYVSARIVNLQESEGHEFAFEVPDPQPVKDISPDAKSSPEVGYKWIWCMLKGEPHFDKNNWHRGAPKTDFGRFHFSKVTEGGGLAWLEPYVEGSAPKNTVPNGYFVTAKGEAKILSAEWREYNENWDGTIITKSNQQLNNSVILDIYTQGLYGQYLHVEILAENGQSFGGDDSSLSLYESQYTSEDARKKAAAEAQKLAESSAKTLETVVVTAKKKNQALSPKDRQIIPRPPAITTLLPKTSMLHRHPNRKLPQRRRRSL